MYAQTSLKAEFLESKCPKGSNVKNFLSDLHSKRETLTQSGVTVSDDDFHSTIISSLPGHLAKFASAQITSAELTTRNAAAMFGLQLPPGALQAMRTVDPDVLIHIVSDESEREAKEREKRVTNRD
ncbi:hypothetical protein ACEPAG_3309 [Sanghuangporus baumii]